MKTARALVCLALAGGCGDRARGTPFAGAATPELRAAVTRVCADPKLGSSVETEPYGSAQSEGLCYLRLDFDEGTLAIEFLVFRIGVDYEHAERIMRDVVLPTLKPEVRKLLEERVLATLTADADFVVSRPGTGEVRYRNHSRASVDDDGRPIERPMIVLSISRK